MPYHVTVNRQSIVKADDKSNSHLRSLSALQDGGWLVLYEVHSVSGKTGSFQRFDADGNRRGSEVKLRQANDTEMMNAAAPLADGGWILTYSIDSVTGSNARDVFQQRYDHSGRAVGSAGLVNTHLSGNQGPSDITALKDGGWVVSWTSDGQDGGGLGVYQQRYSKSGSKIGAENRVNSTTWGNEGGADITSLSDGGWVVTWQSSVHGIMQKRYDKDGKPSGGETLVAGSLKHIEHEYKYASVAALKGGGWVVTWSFAEFYDMGTGKGGAYQQVFDRSGNKVGAETRLNQSSDIEQYGSVPAVAALKDGGHVVVWSERSDEGDFGADILLQRFDSKGKKSGEQVLVSSHEAGIDQYATVTAFKDGSWVVAWWNEGAKGEPSSIFQRYFAADLVGTSRSDALSGKKWSETLIGGRGDDTLQGKGGDDLLIGGRGADRHDGGSGTDTASYETSGEGVVVNLAEQKLNRNDAEGDSFVSIEIIRGSDHADSIYGNEEDNRFYGGSGNDHLYGAGGNDLFVGGNGADRLDGGRGFDTVSYADANSGVVANLANATQGAGRAKGDGYVSIESLVGSDFGDILEGNSGRNALYGGAGDDILIGADGADKLDGGSDIDTVSYADAKKGLIANLGEPGLNSGDARGDTYVSVENLVGTRYNDTLTGNAGANVLFAGKGDDLLKGGKGNDVLVGGTGADDLVGGSGLDMASYEEAVAGVVASLSVPADNTGEAKGDRYSSVEGLVGSDFNDILRGSRSDNTLIGGEGNDVLHAGSGNDTLWGGGGKDVFVFKTLADMSYRDIDLIADLAKGDRIDLSALDADTTFEGRQSFAFIGPSAFGGSGQPGDLWWTTEGDRIQIRGDVDGGGVEDFVIEVGGTVKITEALFIL